jgi:hypothetical protein
MKNDLLLEKYMGHEKSILSKGYTTAGSYPESQLGGGKMKGTPQDLKMSVAVAINTIKPAIEGVKAYLKDYDKKFIRKVLLAAVKQLGV